jgi:hypothetical protein
MKLWNHTKRLAQTAIYAYRLTPELVRMAVGFMVLVALVLANMN